MALRRVARLGQAVRGQSTVAGDFFQAEYQTNGRRATRVVVSLSQQGTSNNGLLGHVVAWIGSAEEGQASHIDVLGVVPAKVPGAIILDVLVNATTRGQANAPYDIPLDVPVGRDVVLCIEGSSLDDGAGGQPANWSFNIIGTDDDEPIPYPA